MREVASCRVRRLFRPRSQSLAGDDVDKLDDADDRDGDSSWR